MLNSKDILETILMIQDENLDVRTITMGISLLDCADSDINRACDKIYDKICRKAGKLVETGETMEKELGIVLDSSIQINKFDKLFGSYLMDRNIEVYNKKCIAIKKF